MGDSGTVATFPGASEYDVAANEAHWFPVGELLGALHHRGFQIGSLSPTDFGIGDSGLAFVRPQARLTPRMASDLIATVSDLRRALERHPPARAQALLAGYARFGYESIDREVPGFTSVLLAQFQVRGPGVGGELSELDFPALLRDLQVDLRFVNHHPTLVLSQVPARTKVWTVAPRQAFCLILAFLVVGVDCRALFARDRAWYRFGSHSALYQLLWPKRETVADPQVLVAQLRARAPGLELAIGLAFVLRNMQLEEPFDFNGVIFWVRKVLDEDSSGQAEPLGDIFIDAALRCAALATRADADPRAAESYLQKAIIILQYTSRGTRYDESRLVVVTRGLYAFSRYPKPFEPWSATPELGLWNSLLITYRELAARSFARYEQGELGALRSVSLRGLVAARHTLRLTYAAASSGGADTALVGLAALRITVKNYAHLISTLGQVAEEDWKRTGQSGWLERFVSGASPSHFSAEMLWIGAFFAAAASEGFSLDLARRYMRDGAEFLVDSHIYEELPHLADGAQLS